MWLGMTSDDFGLGDRARTVLYRSTGLVLEQPVGVPHGVQPGPTVMSSLKDTGLRLEIEFRSQYDRYRTDQGITPEIYDDLGPVGLRKKYGALITLSSARSAGETAVVWTRDLLQQICDLKFYAMDISGYQRGEQPQPDRIHVIAPEIPVALHGFYRNSHARSAGKSYLDNLSNRFKTLFWKAGQSSRNS